MFLDVVLVDCWHYNTMLNLIVAVVCGVFSNALWVRSWGCSNRVVDLIVHMAKQGHSQ